MGDYGGLYLPMMIVGYIFSGSRKYNGINSSIGPNIQHISKPDSLAILSCSRLESVLYPSTDFTACLVFIIFFNIIYLL
jgi:hypothetical protein